MEKKIDNLKQCKKCGEFKAGDVDNFYRQKSRKDGLHPWCKPCAKKHRADNMDKERARNRKRWKEDEEWRESRISGTREWRSNNKEHKRKYEKMRREKYPEEYRDRRKRYYESHSKAHKVGSKARNAVYSAIQNGLMRRPSKCTWCNEKYPQIEAAHHNYNLPLDIIWLCLPCHTKWDYEHPKLYNEESGFDVLEYFYGEETNKDAIYTNETAEEVLRRF